ncbi:hypothetical protein CF1_0030 [Staphylococcus phage CF1]|nr:hypothetical protein [Staphylococcus lugdunensis]MDU6254791.1 hypothetical protein [Staphylococcus warneri]WRW34230.1 hypothetical protein CF1_0030 [Staphylococcus phage CF1]
MIIKLKDNRNLSDLDATVYIIINGGVFKYKTFVCSDNIIFIEKHFNNIYKLYIDTKEFDIENIEIGE